MNWFRRRKKMSRAEEVYWAALPIPDKFSWLLADKPNRYDQLTFGRWAELVSLSLAQLENHTHSIPK